MSYCVNCGVELSDYHGSCPLCHTAVINPNIEGFAENSDYPNYQVNKTSEKKRVRKIITGSILSIQFLVYAIITLFLDLLISKSLSWSLIVTLSLALLWITVAYPFFRKRNTFFRLFSYDCAAVIVYLLLLNLVVSQAISWSLYTTYGILLLWVIIAGIFLTDRIRRFLPITLYYIFSVFIMGVGLVLLVGVQAVSLSLVATIGFTALGLSLVSYFAIRASKNGVWGLITVLLVDATLITLVVDLAVHYFVHDALRLGWSLIVITVTIPAVFMLFAIKRSAELKSVIAKKLHRS